jgi:hypothetical protein
VSASLRTTALKGVNNAAFQRQSITATGARYEISFYFTLIQHLAIRGCNSTRFHTLSALARQKA